MALTFKKKVNTEGSAPPESSPPAEKTVQKSSPAPAAKSSTSSLLKRGKETQKALENEEKKSELRQSQNKFQRFWVDKDKDASVTFLDGDLDSDGVLDVPSFYEHHLKMNGRWGNFFACLAETEPCPICEGGNAPAFVALLTVIDHREYKSSDNKIYKDQVRLMPVKRESLKKLQKAASKRGGLRGWRVDISRTGEKSASIGDTFDFQEHFTDDQIVKKYGKDAVALPYDDVVELITYPVEELRKLGFGSLKGPVGSEPMPSDDALDKEM